MEVPNPNRILVLGSPGCDALKLVRDLTGSAPTPIDESIAGLIHTWSLSTKYYTAEIPLWIDQISDLDAWKDDFLSAEAQEVIQALGGWIYCFAKPVDDGELEKIKTALGAFSQVIRNASEGTLEMVQVAVAMPQSHTPQLNVDGDTWDDICQEHGFEFVDVESTGRNQYGELTGVPRLREALEANDWAGVDPDDDLTLQDDADEVEADDMSPFTGQRSELMEALSSLRGDADEDNGGTEQDQVEQLEKMMRKITALRDTHGSIPEAQRKKLAGDVANDLFKSLD
ncbi:hypothetical protein P152DRAFT_182320 [Eremomyces bilateralis CBS 781.70]|uniref:Alpha and gamma adaptin binding protein p34 n=1 Tax=Eremomyces bilateralis CBS 781.70 TaxID=1392243 RepID=A0A6G1GBB1_9PEZI|nr:uncharacterized protein P152DRAFT_182320 [Eremomyces bilateralis CBS 781.70]KAF1815333.1 hypothetical protein P152DRAFT_182320 [Eremomyces bilateralis CBS 781.70]